MNGIALISLATLFFIALQGLFAGMETGMVSIRKPRAEHAARKGSPAAKLLMFFVNKPGVMISTTLIGVNVCVVMSSLCVKALAERMGFGHGWAMLAFTGILSVLLLCCEMIPKSWFRQAPFERCSLFAFFLYGFYFVFAIPIKAFSAFAETVNSFLSKSDAGKGRSASSLMREDLRLFLKESEEAGTIDTEAASILDKTMDLHMMKVDDIKIEKSKVWDINSEASVSDAIEFCREKSISRVPVRSSDGHAWEGIFCLHDAIFDIPRGEWDSRKARSCLRRMLEVSASSSLVEVLERTRGSDMAMLIVVDGSGSLRKQCGIITAEDVVRHVFG